MQNGETGFIIVNSENELNNAIAFVNKGGASKIDIQTSFILTKNTNHIEKSVDIISSNNSELKDGGFTLLHIKNGAQVSFAVSSLGTGVNIVDGCGCGSALIGKTGGSLANLTVQNDGIFIVNSGERFFVQNEINILPGSGIAAGMRVDGILFNNGKISATQGIITTGAINQGSFIDSIKLGQPSICDLDLVSESYLKINSNIKLLAGKVNVNPMCSITSDGTSLIWSKDIIKVLGNNMQISGSIQGVNVNDIELIDSGLFCGVTNSATGFCEFKNGKANSILNTSGVFDMGISGTCTVNYYKQINGTLQFTLKDFTATASLLKIFNGLSIEGGKFIISSYLQYIPPHTTTFQKIKIVESISNTINLQQLAKIVTFANFPTGVMPSVTVEGNYLYLILNIST